MKTFCYIQARKGSKRFPGKNLAQFKGKPLIQYAIDAAKNAGFFDTIVVTSDDEDILDLATDNGVIAHGRSDRAASDTATDDDVAKELYPLFKGYDICCRIYACVPLLPCGKIGLGLQMLMESDMWNYDNVIAVAHYPHPPERALYLEEGKLKLWMPEYANTRTQDLKPKYYDPGAFQIFKVSAYERTLWMNNTGMIVLGELEHQDIDYPKDLELAGLKYDSLKMWLTVDNL